MKTQIKRRNPLSILRVILHRTPKPVRIDGWRKCGPLYVPDKRKVKP